VVFAQNKYFTLSSEPAHCFFHSFEVSQGASNWSLKNCGLIYDAIFFTCMHAHKSLT